ncbi:MAG TPA: type II toxin-antitoxin system prevent-host-death family antitoxin [Allosphingosinicella sp.]|jgi:antitoxin YefM|nr:type II toxin-antitoxin system prevent-host-death family antitoxin [Allosphingosinicella sp.]
MDVISYTDARANLKRVMDNVVHDRAPTIITRRNGEAVVMVSLDEWNAMEATEHLLGNPANAQDLLASIAELDAGKGVERELIQP